MRLIALDFDGTIVDSKHSIMYAVDLACKSVGIPTPKLSKVMQLTGLKLEDAIAHLVPHMEQTIKTQWAEKFLYYTKQQDDKHMPSEVLFDNVLSTLDVLHDEDTFLAVITGKGREGLDMSLREHGLESYFVITKTADDGPGKPNPSILLDTMRTLGVDAEKTVMVGDTTFDILTGKNASTKTIGVSYGNHTLRQLQDAQADVIIDTFDALPQAINTVLD